MSKRRILTVVVALLLVCGVYFLLPTCKPTLYGECFVSGELEVQAGFNEDRTEVWYAVVNHTDRDIVYDFVVLERLTGDGWQEVLTRTFQRQSEIGRTAVEHYFPAGETKQGSFPLADLRMRDAEHYRVVFPLVGNVIASAQF